ncbi:hypothetical protein JCM5805K_1820 [Lactococcus lactis subsp. lactis]|uniref:Uncharacterized protein n=1 Tax=Lactococcus lactis subsp. lactis TaxID=1360 RepID=A0A0B8QLB5_LACLL|nr:hypothetical protein JCM5805K_1820 [Lactococcus lactis subsp. lactis]
MSSNLLTELSDKIRNSLLYHHLEKQISLRQRHQ